MFICSYTRFFLYKKHKCKKHRIPSFSIANLRNSVVNYRKSVDRDPIEMFLMNKISVYLIFFSRKSCNQNTVFDGQ